MLYYVASHFNVGTEYYKYLRMLQEDREQGTYWLIDLLKLRSCHYKLLENYYREKITSDEVIKYFIKIFKTTEDEVLADLFISLKEIENSKKQLIVIKSVQLNNLKVSPGSIIFTSNNNYFISISSEIYSSDTNKIYCVSTNTPIAKSYLGKKIGDIVTFNNIESKIEKII